MIEDAIETETEIGEIEEIEEEEIAVGVEKDAVIEAESDHVETDTGIILIFL